jgi:hypothetical protein
MRFYEGLGFAEDSVMRDKEGRTLWASAKAGSAEIFFARADAPIVPEDQAVIFYIYCDDVQDLRAHLLDVGLHDGGSY